MNPVMVAVCNFNYAQFIGKAIDSALPQDYPFVLPMIPVELSKATARESPVCEKNKRGSQSGSQRLLLGRGATYVMRRRRDAWTRIAEPVCVGFFPLFGVARSL